MKLQRILELQTKPFFKKPLPDYTEQDRADGNELDALRKEVQTAAAVLKKGDRVQFILTKTVKDKTATFGIRLIHSQQEGTVHTPLTHV